MFLFQNILRVSFSDYQRWPKIIMLWGLCCVSVLELSSWTNLMLNILGTIEDIWYSVFVWVNHRHRHGCGSAAPVIYNAATCHTNNFKWLLFFLENFRNFSTFLACWTLISAQESDCEHDVVLRIILCYNIVALNIMYAYS